MGGLCTSRWLDGSILDEIYAWEAFLLCPSEEPASHRFNPDKELRLKGKGDFLSHWLDLNA